MKTAKKLLIMLVAIALLFGLLGVPVYGGSTDTFNVTVRGKYLDIQVNQSAWAINSNTAIEMSSQYWSNESQAWAYFKAILYNNSVNVDLKLHVSSDGADWNYSTTTSGSDKYVLNATHDEWVTPLETIILTNSAQTLKSNIASGTNQTFDLRFDAPTSTTSGDLQTFVVTATVAET